MITVAKALKIISQNVGPLAAERIDIVVSIGRVLAEPIVADTDMPPFDRSQMDGFAIMSMDTPATLKLVGESAAGRGWHKELKPGEAIAIMTGAPVPKGADAVQKIELTRRSDDKTVDILEAADKDNFIIRRGAEIKKGTAIFLPGEIISENMIASLAAFGYVKIRVSKQAHISILGTGSEIVEIGKKPGRDQIRNSNSVMLDVLARKFGATTTVLPNAVDEVGSLSSQIKAAAKNSDVLIITGGVSIGKYDLTKLALTNLGAEIFFDKVRLKPGKPAVFARLGRTLIFGLPGNPVSAAVTFHLFVRPAILQIQSATRTSPKVGFAVISSDVRAANERDTYLPTKLSTDKLGHLFADPLKWQGSSDFIGFARADALIVVARGKFLSKGDVARIEYL